MKKIKLFLLLILVGGLLGCSSNEEKVAIDTTKFETTLINNGFATIDNSSTYKNETYILNAYKGTYQEVAIEFIEYSSSENAEKVLQKQIETFNLRKSTGASTTNQEGKNFHKYILISNNYYMISVRVDNTLVFSSTPLANKDIIENIFNSIGY